MRGSWRELAVSSAIAVVVLLAVWGRLVPIIVDSSSAVPGTVSAGEVIEIERVVRATRGDCGSGDVDSQIIDSHRVIRPLDMVKTKNTPATGTTTTKWMVPETMPPGDSTYRSTISYQCFPFFGSWPVHVVMPEVHFWVRDGSRQRFGETTPGTP